MLYSKRIKGLRETGRRKELDVIIVTSWDHLYYLTAMLPIYAKLRSLNPLPLLVPMDPNKEPIFVTTYGFYKSVKDEFPKMRNVRPFYEVVEIGLGKRVETNRWRLVKSALEEWKLTDGRIGVENKYITLFHANQLRKMLPKADFIDCSHVIDEMMMIKSPEEIAYFKKACEITNKVLEIVVGDFLKTGKTERELASNVTRVSLEKGVEPSFVQIFSGHRSYYQNVTPTEKKIQRNELVLLDFGVKYKGYCTDITRAVVAGQPSNKQIEIFNAVREIETRSIGSIRPNITASSVDELAHEMFMKLGYAEYYIHASGHGIGLWVSEPPSLARGDDTVLKPGMTLAFEQGIYLPEFGVRLEDNIIVTKRGNEVPTGYQRELLVAP